MNVLISSSGNKVWLVKAFQEAGARVIAYDQDENCATAKIADSFIKQSSLDKLPILCEKYPINCIIPTRNGELEEYSLASFSDKVIVSDNMAIIACLDKLFFYDTCESENIPIAKKYPSKLFARPISGSGSKGIHTIDFPECIIQEFIDWPEYTVDVFIHPDGTPISAVPRQRINVVNGESWVGRTIKDSNLIDASIDLCKKIGLIWQNTVQCFYNGKDIKFIEINPRFGGGCPLSIAAGANSPKWILNIVAGKEIKPCIGEFKDGLTMQKYTEEIFF